MIHKSLRNAKEIATHFRNLVKIPHRQMICDRITRWNISITKLVNLNIQQKLLLLQDLSQLEQQVCLKEIDKLQMLNNIQNISMDQSKRKKQFLKQQLIRQQQMKERQLTNVLNSLSDSQQMLVSKQSLKNVCKKRFSKQFSNKLFKRQKNYK